MEDSVVSLVLCFNITFSVFKSRGNLTISLLVSAGGCQGQFPASGFWGTNGFAMGAWGYSSPRVEEDKGILCIRDAPKLNWPVTNFREERDPKLIRGRCAVSKSVNDPLLQTFRACVTNHWKCGGRLAYGFTMGPGLCSSPGVKPDNILVFIRHATKLNRPGALFMESHPKSIRDGFAISCISNDSLQ